MMDIMRLSNMITIIECVYTCHMYSDNEVLSCGV